MHPPAHIIARLEAIHRWCRVGWVGRDSPYASNVVLAADDLGAYALLDLYPQRLSVMSFAMHWNEIGPVYGSPYDLLQRVPIVKKWITPQQLFSGDVIPMLRRMMSPLGRRVRERNVAERKRRNYEQSQMAKQMAEEWRWMGNKSPHSGVSTAKKHLTKQEKMIIDGSWREHVREPKPLEASVLGMI